MWYAHVIGGVAVFLLGAGTVLLAWRTVPYEGEFGPGPGFLPVWLGITLMVCAIPVIIAALRSEQRAKPLFLPETKKCVRVLGLIVVVFLSLPVLGFPVGLALITAGGMRLMGRHGWAACLATVIGTAVCIQVLFGQWLGIPLPKGMIGW
jgi:putative tricarboxylic transport membrane protein